MKKRCIIFLTLASACVLMLAMTAAPQAHRRIDKRIRAASKIAGPDWAVAVNISNTGLPSESPALSLDDKGKAYVTWVDWTGGYARNMMFNTNESGTWGTSKIGAPLIYTQIDDVGFPTIVASPDGGNATVAYHDGDFSRSLMSIFGFEYSGGSVGTSRVLTSDTSASCSYVTAAVSPTTKNLFIIFMADVDVFKLGFKYRNASTGQWSQADLIPVNEGSSNYLSQMCIDAKGTAHLVWITRPAGAVVWYSKNPSPTNANTWTSPVQISPATGLDWTYPKVTADADGEAYVVWHDLTSGNSEVYLRRTVNGQFQSTENISQTPDLSETASVAVNPTTKELYIVWHENVGGSNWEVLGKTYEIDKASGTKKWSTIINFTNSPYHSGEPCIRVAPNGDVHLVYFDQRGPLWEDRDIFYTFKLKIRVLPPTAVALQTAINKILFYSDKINTITFAKNSDNDDNNLASYKLYRRKAEETDEQFQLLATLTTSTFKYDDRKLSLTQKYAYALSAVDKDGNESAKTAAITEK